MKKIYFLTLLSMAMCVFCRADREIIFDNVNDPGIANFWGPGNLCNEMGDEIYLGGTARTLERFEIECYSSIKVLTPEKYAIIRFYLEDGEVYQDDDGKTYDLFLPNTLLYESYPIQVSSGYSMICLDGLSVPLPAQKFAWTIQFYGLSKEDSDTMGVIIYQEPTVGLSYGDFWMRDVDKNYQVIDKFKTYNFVNMKANFGVRVYASPAPELDCVGVEPVNGGAYVSVKGPVYAPVEIQAASSLDGEWMSKATGVLENGTNRFFLAGEVFPFYRATKVDKVAPNLLMEWGGNGVDSIKLQGLSGQQYSFRYSTNAVDWVESELGTFIAPWAFVNDEAAFENRQQCFYSIVPAEPLEPSIHQLLLLPEQESNWLYLKGPRGRRASISYSYDGENWSKPMKGKFTYFPALSETKEGSFIFPFPRVEVERATDPLNVLFAVELLD